MNAAASSNAPAVEAVPAADRCQFQFADGRLCRMLRWSGHDAFCLFHARDAREAEEQLLASVAPGPEFASLSGSFKTAHDVNRVLGKLFTLRAQNRISRRDAATFAYMSALMLQTLKSVRRETIDAQGHDAWQQTLETAVGASPTPEAGLDDAFSA